MIPPNAPPSRTPPQAKTGVSLQGQPYYELNGAIFQTTDGDDTTVARVVLKLA